MQILVRTLRLHLNKGDESSPMTVVIKCSLQNVFSFYKGNAKLNVHLTVSFFFCIMKEAHFKRPLKTASHVFALFTYQLEQYQNKMAKSI